MSRVWIGGWESVDEECHQLSKRERNKRGLCELREEMEIWGESEKMKVKKKK